MGVRTVQIKDLAAGAEPGPHASSHEDGGSDEQSVAGLSGDLADPQTADSISAISGAVVLSDQAPLAGQVLTATSSTAAEWQDPTGGGGGGGGDASTSISSSTDGRVAIYDGTTGKLLKEAARLEADLVGGPASATDGRVAVWSGATGKLVKNGTKLEADLVTGPASATSGSLVSFSGTTGKAIGTTTITASAVVSAAGTPASPNVPYFTGTRTIGDSGIPYTYLVVRGVVAQSANFTAAVNTFYIVNTTAGAVTVTLPAAASSLYRTLAIKRVGENAIVIDGNAAETIDGQQTLTLDTDNETAELIAFGGAWYRITDGADASTSITTSTDGRVAIYDGTTGKLLKEGQRLEADLVSGPASAVSGHVPVFNGTSGKQLASSGANLNDFLLTTSNFGGAGSDVSGSHQTGLHVTAIRSATTSVNTEAAAAPTAGQVLTATSSTAAVWQTPAIPTGGGAAEFISKQQRHFYGRPPTGTTAVHVTLADQAYWVYIGKTSVSFLPGHVYFYQGNTPGTGTQHAQVFYATTPSAPNRTGQTLTVVDVVSNLDSLTTGNSMPKGNAIPFTTPVDAGVHLWAGYRTNMGGGQQPSVASWSFDMGQGEGLITTTVGTVAKGGTYAGSMIVIATHPFMMITLD